MHSLWRNHINTHTHTHIKTKSRKRKTELFFIHPFFFFNLNASQHYEKKKEIRHPDTTSTHVERRRDERRLRKWSDAIKEKKKVAEEAQVPHPHAHTHIQKTNKQTQSAFSPSSMHAPRTSGFARLAAVPPIKKKPQHHVSYSPFFAVDARGAGALRGKM